MNSATAPASFSTRDLISALFVVLIWGTNFVAMKVGLRNLTPFQMGAARYIFAVLPLIEGLCHVRCPVPTCSEARASDSSRPT